jgi:hypothetical protein
MVKPQFVIDTMREQDYRFFIVTDSDYRVVYQSTQNIPLEESIKRLQKFYDSAETGLYRVQISPSNDLRRDGSFKVDGFMYEIMLNKSLDNQKEEIRNMGMGGMGYDTPQNPFLDRYIGSLENTSNLNAQMLLLQKEMEYERRLRDLRDEYEKKMRDLEANSGMSGIMGEIVKELGPQAMKAFSTKMNQQPINGIDDTETMEQQKVINNMSTQKEKLLEAVNTLIKLDPNFPENLAKLAELAKNKPSVYKMAVEYLKSM